MAKQTYHAIKKEEVLQLLTANPTRGLEAKEATVRLTQN